MKPVHAVTPEGTQAGKVRTLCGLSLDVSAVAEWTRTATFITCADCMRLRVRTTRVREGGE